MYSLQNFLQQWLQLLGHWISFASHPHQNPPHSNMVNQTLHGDVLLFLPTGFCCQWRFATIWEVTPWIYILDWLQMLDLMPDLWLFWPQNYHGCISIYLSFSLYTEAYYPIEHRAVGLNTIDSAAEALPPYNSLWSHSLLHWNKHKIKPKALEDWPGNTT